jgi:hypothetical protein
MNKPIYGNRISGRININPDELPMTRNLQKMRILGASPMPVVGCQIQVADGVFAKLMEELGVPRPDDVPKITEERRDWFRPNKEKGKSTLHKWVCPGCGLAVRIGINSDPNLVHDVCSEIKGEKVFL